MSIYGKHPGNTGVSVCGSVITSYIPAVPAVNKAGNIHQRIASADRADISLGQCAIQAQRTVKSAVVIIGSSEIKDNAAGGAIAVIGRRV